MIGFRTLWWNDRIKLPVAVISQLSEDKEREQVPFARKQRSFFFANSRGHRSPTDDDLIWSLPIKVAAGCHRISVLSCSCLSASNRSAITFLTESIRDVKQNLVAIEFSTIVYHDKWRSHSWALCSYCLSHQHVFPVFYEEYFKTVPDWLSAKILIRRKWR